jgi:hypothetical protein
MVEGRGFLKFAVEGFKNRGLGFRVKGLEFKV